MERSARKASGKAWSHRLMNPVPYESVITLADACTKVSMRPIRGSGYLAEPLTSRELQVLEAICDGDSNQDIARRLNLALATIKYHVIQIFGKLNVQRRTQAVAVAIYLGLVEPEWLKRDERQ